MARRRRRQTYTLTNRWGTCTYYGEIGRQMYEEAIRVQQEPQVCVLCDKPGATQKLVGTGRKVHETCADEVGIPTVLRTEVDG